MLLAKTIQKTLIIGTLTYLVYSLSDIFLVLFMAIVLTYILYPIAILLYHFFKKLSLNSHLSWDISCSLTLVIFLCISLLLLFFSIPVIINQIQAVIKILRKINLEDIWLAPKILPLHDKLIDLIHFAKPYLNKIIENGISKILHLAQNISQKTLPIVLSFISSFHNLFYGFLIFMMSFHILRDWYKWKSRLDKILFNRNFHQYRESIKLALFDFTSSMRQLVIGQMILSNIMSLYYIIAFFFCGFSPILGVVFGYASVIPYIGDTFAIIFLIFDFLSRGLILQKLLILSVLIFIGHTISSHVLTPILIGNYTGILPIQILFGFMLHTHLLGFLGLLLNIPLCILEKGIFIFLFPDMFKVKQEEIDAP